MAVVGIDFGTLHSKVSFSFSFIFIQRSSLPISQIGVARHRGIDIITNEVSNRATPYVSEPLMVLIEFL